MNSFEELNLKPTTLNALAALGFAQPTEIQRQSIPLLLQGADLVAQARTGTGKTAAFGIPLVEAVASRGGTGAVALVLVPTRELALQVSQQLAALAKGTALRIVAVYGGVGFDAQRRELARAAPLCIVATPGRLLDHLGRRTVRLDGVRHLVLDEADRMLDMGFLPDVERILKTVPRQRQTGLFSATLPGPILQLCRRFLHRPTTVRAETGPTATPDAQQYWVDAARNEKADLLRSLLEVERPERAIVFTRTKHLARRLARALADAGHEAVALQGNMSQAQRERALADFRNGRARILVATDIASRGLDIPDVTHVVNYDLPDEADAYVHRIGRTARMGRSGRAFSFVSPDQRRDLAAIERVAGLALQPFALARPPSQPRPSSRFEGAPGRSPQRVAPRIPSRSHVGQHRHDGSRRPSARPSPERGGRPPARGGGDAGWALGPGAIPSATAPITSRPLSERRGRRAP